MKLKHLFTVNLFIALFFGVTCTFFAGWVLGLYGLVPDTGSLWTTRLEGGSILGFASLMWFGLRTESREARRAIALALFIQDSVGFVATLIARLGGPVLYGLLALAYAYFLFIRPEKS